MKAHLKPRLLAALLGVVFTTELTAQTNLFTYQGRLQDAGVPAAGTYDLRFRLYGAVSEGIVLGGPLTNTAVAVADGLFNARLDFGSGVFTGEARWLEIGVRTNGGGAFTTLAPRQLLTPSPYALFAPQAGTAATASAATNVPWTGLTGVPAGFVDGVDNDTTYTAGTGLGLSGTTFTMDATYTDGRYWKLSGNAGTTPGTHFVGTTDNQALEMRVNNQRALRIEPDSVSPNLLGGSSANVAGAGVHGAMIGGGGEAGVPNQVRASFTTLSGGYGNAIHGGAEYAAIGGGAGNTIENDSRHAVVSGGQNNLIASNAWWSVISGGEENQIGTNALWATVPGGRYNTAAGNSSLAAGYRAQAKHIGAFVWADSTESDFTSSGPDQFLIRANGGVGIGTTGPTTALEVVGTVTATEFSGSGARLTDLSGFALDDESVTGEAIADGTITADDLSANTFWQATGNAGTTTGTHFLGTTDNQPLAFRVNNTEAARLANNGNLGLGTPSPAQKLDVAGNIAYSGNLIKLDVAENFGATLRAADFLFGHSERHGGAGLALTDGGDRLVLNFSGDWPYTALGGTAVVDPHGENVNGLEHGLKFGGGGSGEGIASQRQSPTNQYGLDFFTAGTSRLSINNDGNVGIGTMEPAAKLEVNGNVRTPVVESPGNQPLELWVNGLRALRLEPTAGAPNVIGGDQANAVAPGVTSATIAGGLANMITADFGTIAGGAPVDPANPLLGNRVFDRYGSIGGGGNNRAGTDDANPTNAFYATVAGGGSNWATGEGATVGGGFVNEASGYAATVPGGDSNTAGGDCATIAGGQNNTIETATRWATIGGGDRNTIQTHAEWSTIGGGVGNTIRTNAWYATLGGGYSNTIQSTAWYAVIGGGRSNTIQTDGLFGTIGGGDANTIQTNADWATIGGGLGNTIQTNARCATIGGGSQNTIETNVWNATIAGGSRNKTRGSWATVGGGYNNEAAGTEATVPGGYDNKAIGHHSFAAGCRAYAWYDGSFVWADRASAIPFWAWQENSFNVRAIGGTQFVSSVDDSGVPNAGVRLQPGANSWSTLCDRQLKENFAPVDGRDVLSRLIAMPISTWNGVAEPSDIRHMGPVAQDFHAAFGLGTDDKSICTVDADGVALAAIQGLNQKVESGKRRADNRLERLEAENKQLKQRLEQLEGVVQQLTPGKGGAL